MNTAFLICGPESSGNRLFARILIAAGCYGDGSTHQRLDEEINTIHRLGYDERPQHLVWIRSFPHGSGDNRHWPDMGWLGYVLNAAGYGEVRVLVPQRDIFCTARSQVNSKHVKTLQEAFHNISEAQITIWNGLAVAKLKGIPVSYEAVVNRKLEYVNRLMALLELPQLTELPEKIYDGNAKYYD